MWPHDEQSNFANKSCCQQQLNKRNACIGMYSLTRLYIGVDYFIHAPSAHASTLINYHISFTSRTCHHKSTANNLMIHRDLYALFGRVSSSTGDDAYVAVVVVTRHGHGHVGPVRVVYFIIQRLTATHATRNSKLINCRSILIYILYNI